MVISPSVCSLQLWEPGVWLYQKLGTGSGLCWASRIAQDQPGGGGGVGGEGDKCHWLHSQKTAGGYLGAQPGNGFCILTAGRTTPPALRLPSSSRDSADLTLSKRVFKCHSTATNYADCVLDLESGCKVCNLKNVKISHMRGDGGFHRIPSLQCIFVNISPSTKCLCSGL